MRGLSVLFFDALDGVLAIPLTPHPVKPRVRVIIARLEGKTEIP